MWIFSGQSSKKADGAKKMFLWLKIKKQSLRCFHTIGHAIYIQIKKKDIQTDYESSTDKTI